MKQLQFILWTLVIATLFVVHSLGDEPVKITEYKLDKNGNTLGSKIIIKEDESEVLSDVERTFVPDGEVDDGIPVEEVENNQDNNEKLEITIEDNGNEEEEDKEEGEGGGEEEEVKEHFITAYMGNFIHHPFENEEYRINEEEQEEITYEKEPQLTNKIVYNTVPVEKREEKEKEKQDIETQDKVQLMEEVETEGNEDNNDEVQEEVVETQPVSDNDEVQEEIVETQPVSNNESEEVIEIEMIMDENVIIAKPMEMKNFFNENKRIMIGCFESLTTDEYVNYRNASNAFISSDDDSNFFVTDEIKFFTVDDKQCRNIVKRFTHISMFKNDVVYCVRNRCYEYNPQYLTDIPRLKEFIDGKELPVVTEYDPDRKDEYKQWNVSFLVFLNNDEEKIREDIGEFIGEIAERFIDEFVVFVSNSDKFNINTLDEPRDHNVLYFAPQFQTMYSIQEILEPEDAIDKIAVDSFLAQYKKGYLTPKMIVQDFESMWDYENFVVKSVPRFYYPHALNPNRDSLMVYYKTDCPFSQELLKTIDKMGKKYANYRNIFSIVKYEAEEQKIPKMSLWRKLEGYPTIVLYKANPLSRKKVQFFVYPDNAGRSSVSLGKWIQTHSFYKPQVVYTDEDYKEKEALEKDSEELDETEEEEEKINRYLEDPNLIYTRFGYGKEMEAKEEEEEEEEDEDKENVDFYFDNVTTGGEIPITGTYYELTSTTYLVKTSYYTPPPSIYDDDEEEKDDDEDKKDE